MRQEDSFDADAPRVSAARHRRRSEEAVRALPHREGGGWLRRRHRDGHVGRADEPRVPVPHRTGSGLRESVRRASATGAPSTRISDLELATRLSFFLWSSIPDDELLDAAAKGDLDKPAVLERQVKRMLADPRSENLVTNFASQWLHLRNLDTITPDMRLFPDFDDNLRQAFRRETEMLVDSVIRENRSVLDLLRANYTFVNERLAKHYGIPNVYGSRFRRSHSRTTCSAKRDASGKAGRAAPPGQHPAGHVVSDAHVAGDSRQMDSRQRAGRAAAAAAGKRPGARRREDRQSGTRRSASAWPSIGRIRRARAATN